MRYFLISIFAILLAACGQNTTEGKASSSSETPAKSTEYYVQYYGGEWCPPCRAVKKLLKQTDNLYHVDVEIDGKLTRLEIKHFDVPSSDHKVRYAAGALDITSGDVTKPFVPQFHLIHVQNETEEKIDVFLFPWDEDVGVEVNFDNGIPADFPAAKAMSQYLGKQIKANK